MSVETIAAGTPNTALISIEPKPVVTQQPTPPVPAVTKTDDRADPYRLLAVQAGPAGALS